MSLLVLLLILAADEPAPPEFFAPNDELRGYLLEAAEKSPELQGLHAEWKAALARIPQATSLDDPQLTYSQFVQSDEARFRLGLMQMFPWFGTLRLRGEQAAAEADGALARLYAARNAVFQEVKEAYFDYGFLHDSIRTTEEQAQLLRDMEENVGTRYSLGLSTEADLLRVQIEQSQLEDQYNALLQQRPVASTRLASVVGREAAEELPWPQETPLPPPPPPAPVVLARLRLVNPAIEEMDHILASRERGTKLARRRGRPNITLGLEYTDMKQPDGNPPEYPYMFGVEAARGILGRDADMIREAQRAAANEIVAGQIMPKMDAATDEVMVTVGVSVPIWRNRVRAGILESKHMERAAEAEKRTRTLSLDTEAREALFEMQDALRRHNLYEDVLIPRARQTYDSLQSQYTSGGTGGTFLDVLGSVQVLLNYELEQLRAIRDMQVGAARLERVMGGPWTGGETTDPAAETLPGTTDLPKSEPLAEPGQSEAEEDSPLPEPAPTAPAGSGTVLERP